MAWLKRHWHWLFLLLIPLVPLWRAVLLGEAIGPWDQIRQFAPWNGPPPKDAWDVLQADGALQFYVWRDLVFESWGKFQVPFWNPYELMGTPLLANSQSGALYPPHILMGLLHIPTAFAITLLAWFHLFWAGLGTSKLVRALGGSEVGGAVAGASFALSPFMLSWTALSSVITTVSWIPWALWAVLQFHGQAEAKSAPLEFRSIAMLSLIVAMMFLGGHLQFAAYGVGAVVLLMLFQLKELRARGFGVLFGVGFGVMIAFPQLLPVLKHSADSHRRNVPTEAGYEAYVASAIKPFEFANLVTPKALGDPRTPVEVGQGMTVAEYWPPLAKQGANFAESAVTIGPLVLGLLFLVPWRDRRTWPMATIGVLALLLAMGTILNKILYFGLSGWSSTGSPGRIIVLFVLAACVLAGLGVREVSKRQTFVAVVSMALITLLTVFILPGLHPSWQAGMEQLGQAVVGIGGAGLLPSVAISIVLGMGVLLLIPHVKKSESVDSRRLVPVIPVLLVLVAGLSLISTGKPVEAVKGPEDPHARVAIVNESWGIIAAAKDALMPPNLAALSRIRELGGYDSLLNKNTKRILDEINQQDSAPPANGNIMFAKPTAYWESLVDAGVSEIWSNREIDLKGNFDMRQEDGIYKYRLQSYDQDVARATAGRIPATFLIDSGNRMLVEATGPGTLSLADRNLPGWSATVDGKEAAISPGDFLAIELPAGKHQVDFRYVAPGFGLGLIIGLPALLLALFFRRPRMIVPGD